MSGIAKISKLRKQETEQITRRTSSPRKELYLKEDEQVFLASQATGNDDDPLFDAIELYTWPRPAGGLYNLYKHPKVDDSIVPDVQRASRKFAFWAYVFEVYHPTLTEYGRENGWEETPPSASGRTMFKETVNDFRVISFSYRYFDQIEQLYEDHGTIKHKILRIRRTGSGLYDTSYTIVDSNRTTEVPEPENPLPSIEEYFLEQYGEVEGLSASETSSSEPVNVTTKQEIEELF